MKLFSQIWMVTMTELLSWEQRPPEEAHLFNPAFCGALTYEFAKSYIKASGSDGVNFALVFCALPITLHLDTREKLPSSIRTSLHTWLQRHPEVRVGYSKRTEDLVPFVREGISFGLSRETFEIDKFGKVTLGEERAMFGTKFLNSSTFEVEHIIQSTRMVGRWFAGAGTTTTILAAWGITV